jgi:hypothetical protein
MGRVATSPFSIVFQILRIEVLVAGTKYAERRAALPPHSRKIVFLSGLHAR